LLEECKESINVPIHQKGDKTDSSNYRGISVLLTTYKTLSSILLSKLTPYAEETIRDQKCGFPLIKYSPLVKQLINKKGNTMRTYMWCLQALNKACNLVRREALHKVLMVFGNPMELGRLINCDQMKHTAESE
jgi:hypothetical protein